MKITGLLALVVIALCGGLVLAQRLKPIVDPDSDVKNIKSWATAVEGPLQRWGVQLAMPNAASGDGATQSNAVNQFLGLVAHQKGWERLDGLHVDMEFLRRLPASAKEVDRSPKEADVRDVMLELLATLSPGEEATMRERSAEEIVSKVVAQMDYRTWYTREGRKRLFDGRSAPPEDLARAYLSRFCPPVVGIEDGGLSQALYKIMVDQWGVRGLTDDDLRRRPWFVVGCFFEFVAVTAASEPVVAASRPAGGAHVQEKEPGVIERLRKHLPAESAVSRIRLREDNLERVIRDGLREVARKLDVPTSGRDDRTVLEDVRVRLKQVAESALEAVPAEDIPPSTIWYLERLSCRKPTPEVRPPRK